jgi:hypothetical protein
MIGNIFKSIINNFQKFLVVWACVLIANQLFIFGACFAPYCLIAGMPHTGVIAALVTFFMHEENENENVISTSSDKNHAKNKQIEENDLTNDFEDADEPFCSKCGSKMVLRKARKGKYAGKSFWGCTAFPKCNGILNIL